MQQFLEHFPVVTFIAVVGTIVGSVVVLTNPDTLSLGEFYEQLGKFVGGLGVLGVARALISK